jgi:myosin-15
VPSIEEITAITAGRNSKRQMYRLPGGTERVINTKSTSVVQDIIEEICGVINVRSEQEMEEYSLYCIVEGDTFTMPLAREEYILDVTTELQKNQQVYYLIFCRSVWHYPMRLDNALYIEIVFNQIAPDYLEGLLLVMPGEQISQDCVVSYFYHTVERILIISFFFFLFSFSVSCSMTLQKLLLYFTVQLI